MAEYQITYWRELPSLVVTRDGDDVTKSPLPSRFQDAIDEAAMRLGATDSESYLAGWRRTDWTSSEADRIALADQVVADLEGQWPDHAVTGFLDSLGPAHEEVR